MDEIIKYMLREDEGFGDITSKDKFEDLIALLSSKLIQEYQYWGTKNVCKTIPQAHVFAKYSYFLHEGY